MNEEKLEKLLREAVVLVSWSFMASFLWKVGCYNAVTPILKIILRSIHSHGTKQDRELFRKVVDLIEVDITKWEDQKKKAIPIRMEVDEATKTWVKEMLKDITRKLEKPK